ncbi:DUF2336 domain-containing protein [Oricola cellulosilytica]|uniref:DUF2336 domain-containing protein n=1 Tax=Oricola cellulosilytica TaxID=1429082 RepID=A0A4R0P9P2_9HYPH|nr:DUF2336 domain-containing protein [Oricola cellulosilytica]TCD12378.1 DUF2336 domain-containing protein [Oricola cellulosilytica]
MIVQQFLKWSRSADVARRTAAASALARAYLLSEMEVEERCAADAAMTYLLDDPSPKVRYALAEALASSRAAPPHIVTALAGDQYEVASLVIARSPILRDSDLAARVEIAEPRIQTLIANRPEISNRLARAISEFGQEAAAVALLRNANADVCDACRATIAGRHMEDAATRGALLDDPDLSPVLRLSVLKACGEALAGSNLVGHALGRGGAKRVPGEAVSNALVLLASGRMDEGVCDLIAALRDSGALTTKLLIRAVCAGKIDFIARILSDLSGQGYARITAILVDERENQLRALLDAAGLARSVHPLFLTAIGIWRDVANGRLNAGAQEVTRMIIEAFDADNASARDHDNDDIAALLRNIHLDMIRQNARRHALDLAAA